MSRKIFGVPTVLTLGEVKSLVADLEELWNLTYGSIPGSLDSDLAECRKFFDPLVRGHTLRERLAGLPRTPTALSSRLQKVGEPLVTDAGDSRLLIGVEGRLVLNELAAQLTGADHIVIPQDAMVRIHERATEVYRGWCLGRLTQVVQLRTGTGKEVLQAPSVGLVIALLVNRSTTPERAIIDRPGSLESGITNSAVHLGAIKFAEKITSGRKKSPNEQKLRGGYIISEARRRLAHRLVVQDNPAKTEALIYIPDEYTSEVINFLASDLARRPSLTPERLGDGLHDLIVAFRSVANDLASQSLVHERPADTDHLVQSIMTGFSKARQDRVTAD